MWLARSLQLTPWDLFRYTLVVMNVVVAYRWIKRRVLIHEFLIGRWEGTLRYQPEGNSHDGKNAATFHERNEDLSRFEIKCTLMVSRESHKPDVAYLYYRKIDLQDARRPVAFGLESLEHYDNNPFFIINRTWVADFGRVFHLHNGEADTGEYTFRFHCKIGSLLSLLFLPRMSVRVKFKDETCWTGYWTKA
jgi:hypothetical protein